MSDVASQAAHDPAARRVFQRLQAAARGDSQAGDRAIPTQEYLVRHALESFLERLSRTPHGDDFVLKGGILLAAYGIRRPTKDVDAEAISIDLTEASLTQVVMAVANVDADDGVVFDTDSVQVDEIREDAEYTGLRVKVTAYIATAKVIVAWDVSAGDPIVPEARMIKVPRVLGDPVELLGYAPETIVAEKGVTILQRGLTSTRWRDYVDIVCVARAYSLDPDRLTDSIRAVAQYREVDVDEAAPLLVGYGAQSQPKWAAWRTKAGVEDLSEESLDAQIALVCDILDPVFAAIRDE